MPPKQLLMTRRNVYNRAYHKEFVRTSSKELARQRGNVTVGAWGGGKSQLDSFLLLTSKKDLIPLK